MTTQPIIDINSRYIVNPIFILRWEQSQDAHVLLYPEGIVKLNDTGAIILKHCTGNNSVAQIINKITEKYDGSNHEQVANSIINFLEVSDDKGWIKLND